MINDVKFFILYSVLILFALFLFSTVGNRNINFIFRVKEIDVNYDPNCDQETYYSSDQK